MTHVRSVSQMAGLFLALAPVGAALAQAPTTVFTFSRSNDAYDMSAQGFIWTQLGLMGPDNRPGTTNAATGEIRVGMNVVGQVLLDVADNVVGVRNAAGTMRAYDTFNSGWTTNEAWMTVANGGQFTIFNHGLVRNVNANGMNVRQDGGGLLLDGRRPRDGFRTVGAAGAGTGAGFGAVYPLAARANANINVDLNACYSSNDPDGMGPFTAVTPTAAGVTGVAGARGHVPVVAVTAGFPIQGGTAQARAAAIMRLRQAAMDAGFNSLGLWVVSLPFDTRFATIDAVVNDPAVRVGITYRLREEPRGNPPPNEIPDLDIPYGRVTLVDPPAPSSDVVINAFDLPDSLATASVRIGAGDLLAPTYLHISQLVDLPAPAPAGLPVLASGVFDFRFNGEPTAVASALEYRLRLLENAPPDAVVHFFDGAGWSPLATFALGPDVGASLAAVGVLAAFAVPAPGAAALLVMAGWAAARRRR